MEREVNNERGLALINTKMYSYEVTIIKTGWYRLKNGGILSLETQLHKYRITVYNIGGVSNW